MNPIHQDKMNMFWMKVYFYSSIILPIVSGNKAKVLISPHIDNWNHEGEPLTSEDCPKSCDLLFGRLEPGKDGHFQTVDIQERGEPKSGTTFMYEWGVIALKSSCEYLQRLYGEDTCKVVENLEKRHTLFFHPDMVGEKDSPPCSCDNVTSVKIRISGMGKHGLPVENDCPWSHPGGLSEKEKHVCSPMDNGNQNKTTLWNCVNESSCPIVDDRLQFAVFRDPRAVTVSYYFWEKIHNNLTPEGRSVDKFVKDMLPTVTQWVSLRFLLFNRMIKKRSSIFWYNDALDDPNQWHKQFMKFTGLNMPDKIVKDSADVSTGGSEPGKMGVNVHLGGGDAKLTRTYRDEVTPETLLMMDDVLRKWLPPFLLSRFDVDVSV